MNEERRRKATYDKLYNLRNKLRHKQRRDEYYQTNIDKIRKQSRLHNKRNRARVAETSQKWQQEHKERVRQAALKCYYKNKEKILKKQKESAKRRGLSPDQLARFCIENIKWRKAVYKRDNHTCQKCGATNCKVFAHHIKPWKQYPELRFVIDNGITLCSGHHREAHAEYAMLIGAKK